MSSYAVHGEVYLSDKVHKLWQVGGFLRVLLFPPQIKTDGHNIAEILLKVALNTINQTKPSNTNGTISF